MGVQKGILENPNDLAINIAICFPIGVAFMLNAKGPKKLLWVVALSFMSLALVMTYSRSGLLAFIISLLVCVWEYGLKGKRHYLIGLAMLVMVIGLGIVAGNSHYRARVESIVMGNIEGSGDKGSLEARKELLKKSIRLAVTHPLLGVGPGCFMIVDEGWVVAHNSYTELAAEAGFPALLFFLLALGTAFRNVMKARKLPLYQNDPHYRLFTQALWAGLAAYMAGACFASTEYNLYPYFLMAYTCSMVRIGQRSQPEIKDRSSRRLKYEIVDRNPQPVWTR
jgi:O-antigen ligase